MPYCAIFCQFFWTDLKMILYCFSTDFVLISSRIWTYFQQILYRLSTDIEQFLDRHWTDAFWAEQRQLYYIFWHIFEHILTVLRLILSWFWRYFILNWLSTELERFRAEFGQIFNKFCTDYQQILNSFWTDIDQTLKRFCRDRWHILTLFWSRFEHIVDAFWAEHRQLYYIF